MAGIDFSDLPDEEFDNPLGESTGAAAIFGTSGGVMEAAIRTAYYNLTGENLESLEVDSIRGMDGVKSASLKIGDLEVNVAVVNGIGNVRPVIEDVLAGRSNYHFIEVMACPGGCINGGGQPIHQNLDNVMKRVKALYEIDKQSVKRRSHDNEAFKTLYKEFLKEPGSHTAHELLHTTYHARNGN